MSRASQRLAARGIDAVERGANHRHGAPGGLRAREQGALVRGGIDALGQAAEHVNPRGSEAQGEAPGLLGAVDRGAAGADNGHVALGEQTHVARAVKAERRGGRGAQTLGVVRVRPREDAHGARGGAGLLAGGGVGRGKRHRDLGGQRGAEVFAPAGDFLGARLRGGAQRAEGPLKRASLGSPNARHAVEGNERVALIHQSVCPTVMQMLPKMSSAEHPRERSLIGLATPCTMGPSAVAPPRRCTSL